MTEAFNCTQSYSWEQPVEGHGERDEEILHETSSGKENDSEVLLASDEEQSPHDHGDNQDRDDASEIFYSSDDEVQPEPQTKRVRRSDTATFLGKMVCRRALASLISIGGSTFERLRKGQPCFTNNARQPLAKHPSFGFTMRGDTGKAWEMIVMFFSSFITAPPKSCLRIGKPSRKQDRS